MPIGENTFEENHFNFLFQLCKKDPRERIHSIQALHKEPFFNSLNFDAVIQKRVFIERRDKGSK